MRAITYDRIGPAHEVLSIEELTSPDPGPGEVRVRIACSGINPVDVKMRSGARTQTLPFEKIIPHSDGAGVIDRVGADVSETRVGERVWIWNACWGRAFGTAAEYCVLPSDQAVRLPDNVDFAGGACFGIPALTAHHAVCMDGGVAGQDILIAGGAGSVGHYAVQLARLKGAARIIASVSGPAKAELARAAGADEVINYKTEDLPAGVGELTDGAGVDRIVEVDISANLGADLEMIRPEGRIVVYGSNAMETPVPFVPSIVKNVRYAYFIVFNLTKNDRTQALADLTAILERDELVHNIGARVPFEQTADGHEQVEQGRVAGNVVVDITDI
jgi:NADPH2:quinone reductase